MEETILFENSTDTYQDPVSAGKRFANYLIDIIIFYIIIFFLGIFLGLFNMMPNELLTYLMVSVVFIGYYTFLEGATGGRTIGKMITGCRAVKQDESPITWRDAFLRSISRIVPFEPFSCLGGSPWHDNWTHTKVVKNTRYHI